LAVTIRVRGRLATVSGFRWRCRDVALRLALTDTLPELSARDYHPDPDYEAAMAAIEALGGELVRHDDPTAGAPADADFSARR
jgi:hypothetical protein